MTTSTDKSNAESPVTTTKSKAITTTQTAITTKATTTTTATQSNAAFLPPMTWDEGDTYEAMKARIRSHIDNTIAWRGLQAGDPMRAVTEYRPNEYDNTYGWLYILH